MSLKSGCHKMPTKVSDQATLSMSLQELENSDWGELDEPWHLAVECHRLRKIPIQELTIDNIRKLIGQEIGLDYLVPVALDILAVDPWVSGDCFDGDLLKYVLDLKDDFWSAHPDWKAAMDGIVEGAALIFYASDEDSDCGDFDDSVLAALSRWMR